MQGFSDIHLFMHLQRRERDKDRQTCTVYSHVKPYLKHTENGRELGRKNSLFIKSPFPLLYSSQTVTSVE